MTAPGGRRWIDDLPESLASQKRLLVALLGWCEADAEVQWLVIGCSLARRNADALSDLDVAIGTADGRVEEASQRLVRAVAGFGSLVECFDHRMPTVRVPHRRVFAQLGDRAQLDAVVLEASDASLPGTVVLYDAAGVVASDQGERPAPAPARVREWACLAWAALANMGKYLRRGSPWEARRSLDEARDCFWQLWAFAEGVPEPEYGVTSVLDVLPPMELPAGIEATTAGLDLDELLRAGLRLAALLGGLHRRLADERGACDLPEAMRRFVEDDLAALGASGTRH